jgi:ribonuclease T2
VHLNYFVPIIFEKHMGFSVSTARVRVFLACAALGLCTATTTSLPDDPGFDIFLLVRSWSPTFCEDLQVYEKQNCSRSPVEAFTLHGLWPEYSNGDWPQFCNASSFSLQPQGKEDGEEAAFDEGDVRMRCEWPSFHGADASFWRHEVEKHGSCAVPVVGKSEAAYFNTALRLHEKYDLNAALQHADISPSDVDYVQSKTLLTAIQTVTNTRALLACGYDGALSEVWMCLDLHLNPMECPAPVGPHKMCGDAVRLPPGARVSSECSRYFPEQDEGHAWRAALVYAGLLVALSVLGLIFARWRRCTQALESYSRSPA